MRVAILGCGPAGLMAAHGVFNSVSGNTELAMRIFSKKRKSRLFGAQYLHEPIPDMTKGDPVRIRYSMQDGTPDEYRAKVYGKMWDGTVSPEDLAVEHNGWDIRQTYDALWDQYHYIVQDTIGDLGPSDIAKILDGGWDIVINSIPRIDLCYKGHTFGAAQIIAAGDAPELGIDVGSMYFCPENTVLLNGSKDVGWYRKSRVFGHTTVEWPMAIGRPPIVTAATVNKPTYHACDCWPELHHVGRYGTWDKKVLSHTAYDAAQQLVKERIDASA